MFKVGDKLKYVGIKPLIWMWAVDDGPFYLNNGDCVEVHEVVGPIIRFKCEKSRMDDGCLGVESSCFDLAGDLEWVSYLLATNLDENQVHMCCCPAENFTFNGRGCVCGGI